jgi:endonuclease III
MTGRLAPLLDRLEEQYGEPTMRPASDPYEMLIAANCGYPASEAACARGLEALRELIGTGPGDILRASKNKLVEAMRAGGIVPELRAQRLREIACAVEEVYGGDLKSALVASGSQAKKILKSFPTIADAGAEKILLFSRIEPIMAVPSNATQGKPECGRCPVTDECAYFAAAGRDLRSASSPERKKRKTP